MAWTFHFRILFQPGLTLFQPSSTFIDLHHRAPAPSNRALHPPTCFTRLEGPENSQVTTRTPDTGKNEGETPTVREQRCGRPWNEEDPHWVGGKRVVEVKEVS